MSNETFIGYSRRDSHFAQRLHERLKAAGIDCWADWDDLSPGINWRKEICVSIQFCHNFLFCLSPASISSQECKYELDHALLLNKRIIPLLVSHTQISQIPPSLQELNWLDFSSAPFFDTSFKKLLQIIESPAGETFKNRLDAKLTIDIIATGHHREFYLYRKQYILGRKPAGDINKVGLIIIHNPGREVSRSQATLVKVGEKWQVTDGLAVVSNGVVLNAQKSMNGIAVNGKPLPLLELHTLKNKDRIDLGGGGTRAIYEEISPAHDPWQSNDDPTFTAKPDAPQ